MSLEQTPADGSQTRAKNGADDLSQTESQTLTQVLPQTLTQALPQVVPVPPSQAVTGQVPSPLRRPLRSFIEEARDAAEHGLKSSVVFTAAGLTLTFEKQDLGSGSGSESGLGAGFGAGEADNLAVSPQGAPHKGQARTTGQPAPKPWR
jgi:hypothetical protein